MIVVRLFDDDDDDDDCTNLAASIYKLYLVIYVTRSSQEHNLQTF